MYLISCTLSLLLVTGTLAVPAQKYSYVKQESRANIPQDVWIKRGAVPGDTSLPVRIGLTQTNLEKGGDLLMEVYVSWTALSIQWPGICFSKLTQCRSSPSSPRYGKHYSATEVYDLFKPSAATVKAVRDWLVESGVNAKTISQSTNKGWLQFDAKASAP